jgi:hypothetical protein
LYAGLDNYHKLDKNKKDYTTNGAKIRKEYAGPSAGLDK